MGNNYFFKVIIYILQLSEKFCWCGLLNILFIQLIWQPCPEDLANIAYKQGN